MQKKFRVSVDLSGEEFTREELSWIADAVRARRDVAVTSRPWERGPLMRFVDMVEGKVR
jgi:hypothetical protein